MWSVRKERWPKKQLKIPPLPFWKFLGSVLKIPPLKISPVLRLTILRTAKKKQLKFLRFSFENLENCSKKGHCLGQSIRLAQCLVFPLSLYYLMCGLSGGIADYRSSRKMSEFLFRSFEKNSRKGPGPGSKTDSISDPNQHPQLFILMCALWSVLSPSWHENRL